MVLGSSTTIQMQLVEKQPAVFAKDDFEIEQHLGSGSFSSVYSVTRRSNKSFARLDSGCTNKTEDSSCDSERNGSCSISPSGQPRPIALKNLHKHTLKCPIKTKQAHKDMLIEVEILCSVPSHPNIITLHGISDDFYVSSQTAFMIQEQLDTTLDKSIRIWRKKEKRDKHRIHKLVFSHQNHANETSQALRIMTVAVDLAKAVSFLHQHNIIYRDLKPENCGFDAAGNVRLFDFGFSKIIPPSSKKDENFKLTTCIGTLNYMAPEICREEHYNLSADVYSFGSVLWELCTLEQPYGKVRGRQALVKVVRDWGSRPSCKKIASKGVEQILDNCWQRDARRRPSFSQLEADLTTEVEKSLGY
mmetsp:Transcript_8177/g.10684  ORF Transcript_8177/g.10684 Transcript_8177/m.10684 type:complete len:360 (+) Transcript_8177:56-1135(+)